jgi:hypothetical protein
MFGRQRRALRDFESQIPQLASTITSRLKNRSLTKAEKTFLLCQLVEQVHSLNGQETPNLEARKLYARINAVLIHYRGSREDLIEGIEPITLTDQDKALLDAAWLPHILVDENTPINELALIASMMDTRKRALLSFGNLHPHSVISRQPQTEQSSTPSRGIFDYTKDFPPARPGNRALAIPIIVSRI